MSEQAKMAIALARSMVQASRVPNHYANALIAVSNQLLSLNPDSPEKTLWENLLERLLKSDYYPDSEIKRFIPLCERLNSPGARSRSITPESFILGQGTQMPINWRGLPLLKSVWDMALTQELIFELHPSTIIELGSGSGASALWYSDICSIFGINAQIISFDIHQPAIECGATFVRAVFPQDIDLIIPYIVNATGPCLVVEDMHVGLNTVIPTIAQVLRSGDYLLIEDSGPKQDVIAKIAKLDGPKFDVDTAYTDRFGRNGTSAMNSFLRCSSAREIDL